MNSGLEEPYFRSNFFWGVADVPKFKQHIEGLIEAARVKAGWFAGDNLIAFGRNLGFLRDDRFMAAWQAHAESPAERGVIWRVATLVWAARQALRRPGGFVECGCYKGTTARILLDAVDLAGREYFLYDLFEHHPHMSHHAMPDHGENLHAAVTERFSEFPDVRVIKGSVPESFAQGLPEQIAFAHIDMNNVAAEVGCLDSIADRLCPGAVIVLDDFGAIPYRAQHLAETKWFADRDIPVLELPTSQGLVVW